MKSRLLLLFGALLVMGMAERPKPPPRLSPEEAAKQGRALAADLLSQMPAQNLTNSGVIRIRGGHGLRTEIPVKFEITVGSASWSSLYEAGDATNAAGAVKLTVVHTPGLPNKYRLTRNCETRPLVGNETMIPFAGSDFWAADLGLEFLHWPDQRLVMKQMKRGQSCDVLESINPHPAPGAYRRVVSWIDIDSGGIVYAEAYDLQDKLLKEFLPKHFKKVKGQWELEEMEMDNDQTGSRTWIEFNLDHD